MSPIADRELTLEKKPQVPQTYDAMFEIGGEAGVFDLPYKRSPYYPMFKAVRSSLMRRAPQRVLEVGCGTGPLAHLLQETTRISYQGFDFSDVAVRKARARTGHSDRFFVGDATAAATYEGLQYDAIVCTEVLEHLEDDLGVLRHWKEGTYCVCSVPNYDADTHVRFFRDEAAVRARYGQLIDIQSIERRCKPFLNDLRFGQWLKAVRWNRNRPDRLRWLLGFSDFDANGGWFIFAGVRRGA